MKKGWQNAYLVFKGFICISKERKKYYNYNFTKISSLRKNRGEIPSFILIGRIKPLPYFEICICPYIPQASTLKAVEELKENINKGNMYLALRMSKLWWLGNDIQKNCQIYNSTYIKYCAISWKCSIFKCVLSKQIRNPKTFKLKGYSNFPL